MLVDADDAAAPGAQRGLRRAPRGRRRRAPIGLAAQLRERGFEPARVDTTELLKGGGGAKCCTLEIRS